MRVFWVSLALLALAGVWFIIDSPARMSEPAARPVPVPVPAPAPAPAPARTGGVRREIAPGVFVTERP